MNNRIPSRELGDFHTVLDITDSTMNDMNSYIARAIEEGRDIHGHVIQALMQTNSRGSTDVKTGITREWKSREGNLLFSMAVNLQGFHRRAMDLIGAFSIFKAIKLFDLENCSPQINFPNDIFIDGQKVCGVLTSPEFCNGDWCNMGIGVNIMYAPLITDKRNVSTCLARYGWPQTARPEYLLKFFLKEFEKHYQAQLKDPNYVFQALGLMNDEGLIYAYNRDNPHQWAVGQFVGFETNDEGHDFILIKDVYDQIHHFFFLKTEILNPNQALKYNAPVYVSVQKGMQHG